MAQTPRTLHMFLDQTFQAHDLAVVGLLVILEGVLSIDNALVLGLLAKRLPKRYQARALTYGLVGAFVFRLIAIATAAYLLKWRIVKLLGGGYLVYIAVKHLFFESKNKSHDQIQIGPDGHPILLKKPDSRAPTNHETASEIRARTPIPVPEQVVAQSSEEHAHDRLAVRKFWSTVGVIEMTDIAFAIDSILAAIALVGPAPHAEAIHPKLWVIVTGGMLGVILMRFAAVIFIRLLERFPRFETSAYLLVIVIGAKLLVDWGANSSEHPHRVNFHDYGSPAFWVFWGLMLVCFLTGFLPQKSHQHATAR